MLFFINLLMIFFWLLMSIVVCISCVSIAKIWRAMHVELAISFAHIWVFFRFAWASELTAWRKISSLLSLRSDTIRFLWSVNTFAILCRICSINFFCISFISLLFIILIMTSRFLQSDDESFLRHCFLIAISSLVMFAHDVIFVERRMLLYICNCLLSSWTDVFSFYTFFTMNAFWFLWCFSSESSRKYWISFNAISFHEWSLLFSFSNVDIFISRSIMLSTFYSSLREHFDLASLFSCDESTSLAIIFESALLQFMQFIVINHLLDSLCLVCSALFQNLWCVRCDCFKLILNYDYKILCNICLLKKKMMNVAKKWRKEVINDCKQEHWSEEKSYLFINESCHTLLASVNTYEMKMKWHDDDEKWWRWKKWESLFNC